MYEIETKEEPVEYDGNTEKFFGGRKRRRKSRKVKKSRKYRGGKKSKKRPRPRPVFIQAYCRRARKRTRGRK